MSGSFRRVVGSVSVWHVAASICYYGVYVGAPYVRDGLGASRFEVGILQGVLALGYALFLLPIGVVVDAYGERRILIAGLTGLSVCTLAIAVVPSYLALLPVVFVIGVLYGTASPGTNRAIFTRVPTERRNFAMGIKQVGVTAGSGASALLLTGVASTRFGWPGGFVAAAAVGGVVTLLFAVSYPSGSHSGTPEWPSVRGLLGSGPYRWLILAGTFLGAIGYTTTGYAVLYLTESLVLTVGFAGVVLAAAQVSGSVGRVVSGWLADVVPGGLKQRTTAILLVQTLGSAVMLAALPVAGSRIGAFLAFLVAGFFVLGLGGMYFSVLGALVPDEESGSASAGGQLTVTTGGLLAPPAFGYLADVSGYPAAWRFLAACALIASALLVAVYVVAIADGE